MTMVEVHLPFPFLDGKTGDDYIEVAPYTIISVKDYREAIAKYVEKYGNKFEVDIDERDEFNFSFK